MNISLSPETDSEDGSGEDSDSAEDAIQVIKNDPLEQRQVSLSSSPLENRYLAGFIRSPDKTQPDAQAKQALDEDPLSLDSPFKQAVDSVSDTVHLAPVSFMHYMLLPWTIIVLYYYSIVACMHFA